MSLIEKNFQLNINSYKIKSNKVNHFTLLNYFNSKGACWKRSVLCFRTRLIPINGERRKSIRKGLS